MRNIAFFTVLSPLLVAGKFLAKSKSCRVAGDCVVDEYCAAGECLPHGTCLTLLDCMNPLNELVTTACTGFLKCNDDHRCVRDCSGQICPENNLFLNCEADPCEATTCDENFDVCIRDFCGGCQAIYLNLAGERVCLPPSKVGEPGEATSLQEEESSCNRSSDCPGWEYCAAGICRPHGTCGTENDCLNPTNEYMTAACTGFLSCNSDGICTKNCSMGSPCPNNDLQTDCDEDPCQVSECLEDYDSCVRDFCGGCFALFFTTAGEQVCKPDLCPDDPFKTEPGFCGCGESEQDSDRDGVPDCVDKCRMDFRKAEPGICGCYFLDIDSDGDGWFDCYDLCDNDPEKREPGECGCGVPDVDLNENGIMDCKETQRYLRSNT